MPLILAIEPDSRQAALLSDLARGLSDDAELALTTTAGEAIAAIEARVPDLILTSTLLSPADESMLTDRLRELDSAGAHVQTLVIPLLAEPQLEPEAQGGLFSRLGWKKKKASAPDGCDPAVFGGQITEYLNRAHVLRRAFTRLPSSTLEHESRPVEEPRQEPPVAAAASERDRPEDTQDAHETVAGPVLLPESDLVRDPASPLAGLFKTEEPLEPAATVEPPAPETPAAVPIEPLFTLDEALISFEKPAVPEPQWSGPLVTDMDALSAELDAVLAAHASTSDFLAEPQTVDAPVELPPVEPAAPYEPATLASTVEPLVAIEAPAPITADERPERAGDPPFRNDLLELLAAIQLDLEPLRSAPEIRPSARAKSPGGVQDEWGFFDPQQCGMAALLARLDEMARQREASAGPN